MLGKGRLWLERNVPFLFADKMPVWLTIVASITAAVATYYVAPSINRQFQLDDARAQQLAKNIEGLNAEIIELSQKVRRLNSALANESNSTSELREEALDLVTKLQWRLIDLRIVLQSREDRESVRRLAERLSTVRAELHRARDKSAEPRLLGAMRSLAREVQQVLDRLYAEAQLT